TAPSPMMQEGKSRPPHSSDDDSENTAPAKAKTADSPGEDTRTTEESDIKP
ncbi:MAG: 30S ribosomal protein S6, partial [Nitrosomonas sp. PRO5]|nr:30S ribosomal protein S6 [Nitrosomonas sp. PRO5]